MVFSRGFSVLLAVLILGLHGTVLAQTDDDSTTAVTSPPTSSPVWSAMSFTTFSPTSGTHCSNGLVGVDGFGQCCVLECGHCLESGCKARAKSAGLTANDCCPHRISNKGVYCDIAGSAPCTIRETI